MDPLTTYRRQALAELVTLHGPRGEHPAPDFRYRSRFGRWDERASVRVKPWPRTEQAPDDSVYFPPEHVPVLDHPLVAAKGPQVAQELLVRRLHEYLHFTVELEQLAVIPVASSISRGRSGLVLPAEMRADAYKIVTDEAWHAQFSYTLQEEIAARTGVPPDDRATPAFVERLDRVRSRLDPGLRGAEALMFAVVSETLISAILSIIPNDRRVAPVVRQIVRDHAEDEGRHHSYFRDVLTVFWRSLSASEHVRIGRLLPEIIHAFLAPDHRATVDALLAVGLSPTEVEQVVVESYPTAAVAEDVGRAAATTVRYLAELDAFAHVEIADAFAASGLLHHRAYAPTP
ncbi:diiron oxygenase [Micromonospora sp. DT62]|uniref:diiron oxygenase n=1 Tax=Micromonospora sp. DT62 TaxID=3416521 RepID=UPI003CEC79DD